MALFTDPKPEILKVRATNIYPALERVYREPESAEYVNPYGFLPIVVPGGIGDQIVAMPLIDKIKAQVGKVRIYSIQPDIWRYAGYGADLGTEMGRPPFLYYLKLSTAPVWIYRGRFAPEHLDEIPEDSPVGQLLYKTAYPSGQLERFAAYQPNFDGELSSEAMTMGYNRFNLGDAILRFNSNNYYAVLKAKKTEIVDVEPFITVNTGFDATQIDVGMRSTKSLGMSQWAELVYKIKRMRPDLWIIQIGGKNSRPIKGVDENLAGQLPLERSMNLLSRSSLHIDIEGGLVHAAHALGVKSVVMFGPTPPEFFGYYDNVNIAPEHCGGCWWTTEQWMQNCPIYDSPRCMNSTDPETVYTAALKALEEK